MTGIPTVWMYTMSIWALGTMVYAKLKAAFADGFKFDPVPWIGLVLILLALLMLIEAIVVIAGTFGGGSGGGRKPEPQGPSLAPAGVP